MTEVESRLGVCKIAYLDDDQQYAALFKIALSRLGHKVVTFSDPRAATAALREPHSDYDAFVSDFHLPDRSGLDVVQDARQYRPKLPVAVITNNLEDALRKGKPGTIVMISKPVLLTEFADMLARVLAGE